LETAYLIVLIATFVFISAVSIYILAKLWSGQR
jgi:hypothetical protein